MPSHPDSKPSSEYTKLAREVLRDRTMTDFFVRRVYARVHAWAVIKLRALRRDEVDPGGVAQEIVLIVLRSFHRYDGRRSFSAWMFGVARKVFLKVLRARLTATGRGVQSLDAGPEASTSDRGLESAADDLATLIAGFLRSGRYSRQDIDLLLGLIEDRDRATLAREHGTTVGALNVRIMKLRRRLRAAGLIELLGRLRP